MKFTEEEEVGNKYCWLPPYTHISRDMDDPKRTCVEKETLLCVEEPITWREPHLRHSNACLIFDPDIFHRVICIVMQKYPWSLRLPEEKPRGAQDLIVDIDLCRTAKTSRHHGTIDAS
jgi:hypothetical protein